MAHMLCSKCATPMPLHATITLCDRGEVCSSCFIQWMNEHSDEGAASVALVQCSELIEAAPGGLSHAMRNAVRHAAWYVLTMVVWCWIMVVPIGIPWALPWPQVVNRVVTMTAVLGVFAVIAIGICSVVLLSGSLFAAPGYPRIVRLVDCRIVVDTPGGCFSYPLGKCRWLVGESSSVVSGFERATTQAVLIYCGDDRVLCGTTDESRICWEQVLTFSEARRVVGMPPVHRFCFRVAASAFAGKLFGVSLGLAVNMIAAQPVARVPLVLGVAGAICGGVLACAMMFGRMHSRFQSQRTLTTH